MGEWKEKANALQNEIQHFMEERGSLNIGIQEIEQQNLSLIQELEQYEHNAVQLRLENERLKDQVQEMILSYTEANIQQQQIGNKKKK
eukprot:241590_1